MSKKAPFLTEIGLGLLLTGFVAWSYHTRSTVIEKFSLNTYDFLSEFRETPVKSEDVKIVEIDAQSVGTLGRWPWPRALVADLVDAVISEGARVVGLNILYNEADQNPGLEELDFLYEEYEKILKAQVPPLRRRKVRTRPFEEFIDSIEQARINIDGDSLLALTLEEAVDVVLPMYFVPGDTLGNNLDPLPDFFSSESLALDVDPAITPIPSGRAAELPMEEFATRVVAIGHSNLFQDVDGVIRKIAPVIRYGDSYFPSFGLQLVREYLNLQREAIVFDPTKGLTLFKAEIPLDETGQAYIEYAGPAGTFESLSALDVLSGGTPENALANKIVLVGVTAPGLAPTYTIPGGERFSGLEIWANHIANILNQTFISRPVWAPYAEWGMIGLSALIIILILPFVRARFAIPIATLIFLCYLGLSGAFFVKQGMWISPTYGAFLLAAGFMVLVGKRLVFTEKGKEIVEAEGKETNKMLGLSFQGQGMLDLAFEKFRKCEVDQQMKELLYNLGLDMERKRMFTKAAAVYEHIGSVDAKYKDIKEKIEKLKRAGEGAVFGGVGKKGSDATVVVEGLGQHTTLGRYEIIKELGRGAMGIVYLGKDPKINRKVAIKTLRFDDDVNEAQTKSVKERFFREAESAGNLTHPHIIRIFDAGEDQDVAYIAMELLEGQDLKRNCEKTNLFSTEKVLDMVSQIADALSYAHKQGVVHRDIKPANIMLIKDGTLRITDFGIARIQATSKTATGAVLGTPAYMSPEQVNGKKVDGRADIFSLGVTLFEMLTGEKPFQADSIAALLYRIANVQHPDAREYNPKVPEDIIPVIEKALAKEAGKRYQTGADLARAIRVVRDKIIANPAPSSDTPPPPKKSPEPEPDKVPVEKEPKQEPEAAAAPPPEKIPEPEPIPEPKPEPQAAAPPEPQPVSGTEPEAPAVPEPQPQLESPSSPEPTPEPESKKDDPFVSELEKVFETAVEETQVLPPEEQDKTIVLEKNPENTQDKTIVLEKNPENTQDKTIVLEKNPENTQDKTIVLEKNPESTMVTEDIPLLKDIEQTVQEPLSEKTDPGDGKQV